VALAEERQEKAAKEAAAAAAAYRADVKQRDEAVARAEAEAMYCREAQVKLQNRHTSEVAEEREQVRVRLEKADQEVRRLHDEQGRANQQYTAEMTRLHLAL
jgi:hypothetical protein